jgi:hypothetical protein
MCHFLSPRSLTTSSLQRVIGKILFSSALAASISMSAQTKVISADNLTPFQPRDVGTTSDARTVRIKLNYARAISSIAVAPGTTEFAASAVSGCVVDGHTINPALSACSVDVTFSPKYPGLRTAPLVLTDSAGIKSSVGLVGTGLGPQAVLTPGIVTVFAGGGPQGFGGDGGPAVTAGMSQPHMASFDWAGNLYVTDTYNSRVRKIDTNGIITTVAGNGHYGLSGVGGQATSAGLGLVYGIAFDAAGNMYFGSHDTGDYILKVDLSGILTVFAGNGTSAYSGDGGPATQAGLGYVYGLSVDALGNVYLSDRYNARVRKVDSKGIISTIAGDGTPGYGGDGGPATQAHLNEPVAVPVDAAGNLYISDLGNYRIRKVDTNGIITTIAGNGGNGFSGDGGEATQAALGWPVSTSMPPETSISSTMSPILRSASGASTRTGRSKRLLEVVMAESTTSRRPQRIWWVCSVLRPTPLAGSI